MIFITVYGARQFATGEHTLPHVMESSGCGEDNRATTNVIQWPTSNKILDTFIHAAYRKSDKSLVNTTTEFKAVS